MYGWNFTAAETNVARNMNSPVAAYPNGTLVQDDTDSARNRNSGTSRSMYLYTLYGLIGTCRENPYDAVTWKIIPWSATMRSTTVAPLNARPCSNF
jgi:hypothetical protein